MSKLAIRAATDRSLMVWIESWTIIDDWLNEKSIENEILEYM